MRKRTFPVSGSVLGLVLASAVLLGPGSGCTSEGGSGGASSGAKVYRVAVIPKGMTHVFWNSIEAGARRAAKALAEEEGLAVEIIWQGPQVEDNREEQRQVIESFMGPAVDGIVLAPLDERALAAPVAQARQAGKPVVIIDSGLEGQAGRDYESFVATDNRKGGVLAAEEMGRVLGGKGKVLLLRYQEGSASTTNREQGFIETIEAKFPEIELVPPGLSLYAGATAGKAQELAETLLAKYTDIDGIFCPNESSVTGTLQALQNTPLLGKVTFIGFDANDKLVDALSKGLLHGLILQDPVRMGELGVRTLIQYLRTRKVELRIDTGVYLVTRDNMDEPAMQRLLKPDLSILQSK